MIRLFKPYMVLATKSSRLSRERNSLRELRLCTIGGSLASRVPNRGTLLAAAGASLLLTLRENIREVVEQFLPAHRLSTVDAFSVLTTLENFFCDHSVERLVLRAVE